MTSWWQCFQKAFSKEECEWLIRYAQKLPCADGIVGYGGEYTENRALRRSKVRWLSKTDPELTTLYTRIQEMMVQANSNAFGFDVFGFPHVQFTEYHAEDKGTYGWHEDNNFTNNTPCDRKISMVIQLSDPSTYTGGKLKLRNGALNDTDFREQGDTIFFPSFNRHMVTPVTSGTRYSLVSWLIGKKFR